MRSQRVYDSEGHPFEAYQHQLSDGSWLQVDKKIADATGDEEDFVAREIKNAEQAIKEGHW